jgi:hypothetical protein
MNTKFYSCLLALGTFASAVLLGITPAYADGNGSNNGNNVGSIGAGSAGNGSNTSNNATTSNPGNGSNTTNNVQFTTVEIAPQALANVNAVLTQILGANPQALTSVTSPEALVPSGASTSVSDAAKALNSAVAGLNGGGITGAQLNEAINAYNAYAEALVESVGGEKAVAFLSSAGGVKSKDGTPAPSLRSQLLKLREAAGV